MKFREIIFVKFREISQMISRNPKFFFAKFRKFFWRRYLRSVSVEFTFVETLANFHLPFFSFFSFFLQLRSYEQQSLLIVFCLPLLAFFFASLWELLASPWNSQGRQKFCAIVNVYCDPVCTVDDVCSVDVLRILTFGYNRGFLSTSRRSMVSVQNYIARKIGSEFESLDYILHRLDNCTIFAIQSKHLKL